MKVSLALSRLAEKGWGGVCCSSVELSARKHSQEAPLAAKGMWSRARSSFILLVIDHNKSNTPWHTKVRVAGGGTKAKTPQCYYPAITYRPSFSSSFHASLLLSLLDIWRLLCLTSLSMQGRRGYAPCCPCCTPPSAPAGSTL